MSRSGSIGGEFFENAVDTLEFCFSPSSASPSAESEQDLMSFVEIEPIIYGGGESSEIDGNTGREVESLVDTTVPVEEGEARMQQSNGSLENTETGKP